jgi:N-acetyl-anhydromuramyl-L-alanine amidase AmpD
MAFREFAQLSPNRDVAAHERLGVLFHHSGMDFDPTIGLMVNPGSRVSYHCLIGADGTRCTLVPETEIAWHAGVSRFLGRDGCNGFLLGVSFAGDTYAAPLSKAQVSSALEWLEGRWTPRGWSTERVTDHRQVSPGRKKDLNPEEWGSLAAAISARFGPAPP